MLISFWVAVYLLGLVHAIWPFDSFESTLESLSPSSTGDDSSPTSTTEQGVAGAVASFFGFGETTSATVSVTELDNSSTLELTSYAPSSLDINAYQPFQTDCPSQKLIRESNEINEDEKEYITNRSEKTNENLIKFLTDRAKLTDFDAEKFINSYSSIHNISIGLAFSGGGYRAMLAGAGEILALDDRFDDANENGLGGLLQSSTYLVGLSGGSWLVGTLVLNDWISVKNIIDGDIAIWDLSNSIFNPGGLNLLETARYYDSIDTSILAKSDAGFNASITDVWGRALSYQFFPDGTGGRNVTWSGIRDLESFKNYDMPYPIIVATGRTPETLIINENSTVFEIGPYELGSWDPSLGYFADTKYIGSSFQNGDNITDQCVVNFDNAGFMMGTSSSLFNQAIVVASTSSLPLLLKSILMRILGRLSYDQVDIATYSPNPFFQAEKAGIQSIVNNQTLFLADGGLDKQNVPFYPLIQNARDVDVIFGFDNSADTNNWPNGSAIVETYLRQFATQGKSTPFPYVPDVQTFVDDNLIDRPWFFGCDSDAFDALLEYHENNDINGTDVPLVVYIPNSEYSAESNKSTAKLSYDEEERGEMYQNGFEVSTRGNFTQDSNWNKCVGCAIIRRSQERLGLEQSDECISCFEEYCWTGGVKEAAYDSVFDEFVKANGLEDASNSGSRSSSSVRPSSTGGSGGAGTGASSTVASDSTGTSADSSSSSAGAGSREQVYMGSLLTIASSFILLLI